MIDVLKKRHKIGDTITLHTAEASFTGVIDAFEDTCVILLTKEGDEFIANNTIKRISVHKSLEVEKTEVKNEKVVKPEEEIKPLIKKEEIESEKVQETLLKVEYKVGDKIPLDELEKRTNKKIKLKLPKTKEKGIRLDSLSDLKELILPEIEAENKKIVSANGTITKYFVDRTFGFITDKFGYDIWFGFNNIIDENLLRTLRGTNDRTNIPVLFSLSKNYKGHSAINIHKPKIVEQVAELAQRYFEKEGKSDTALGLVEQILFSYPDNYTAIKLKEEIEQKRFKQPIYKPTFKSYDLNYQKAKKLHYEEKNYESALKYYFLALKNNEKKESCIKDIAMLYISMERYDEAVKFMKEYEKNLQLNITNYNFLIENFYRKTKNYEKIISYSDLAISIIRTSDKKLYSKYLSFKGTALAQLNKIDEAREALEEALSIHPGNTYANRLLQALDEPDNINFDKLVAEAEEELAFLGSEVSNFLKEKLSLCEFDGLKSSSKSKIIENGEFKKYYLEEIRDTLKLKEIVAGKSKERADYLLTEVRLMQELEPDKETDFRSTLAKYCNAKASQAISEMFEGSLDVARHFYLESFNLEDEWESLRTQAAMYLSSLKSTNKQLITNSSPSFDNTLQLLFQNDTEVNLFIWNSILSAFVLNKTITAHVLKRIYDINDYRLLSLNFLKSIGIQLVTNSLSFSQYLEVWDSARGKRNKEYRNWNATLKAIANNDNLETLVNLLLDSLREAKKNWLTQLDASRLNVITSDIYDVLATYLKQSGYRDKERTYNFAKVQINQLITEIKEKPTKFSYEGFIPLLEKTEILLDRSFKTVEAASSPKVDIYILGESNVLGNDNVVHFQVKVETSKNSSPIRNLKIAVQNTIDITFVEKNNEYFDSIDGGESYIFNISVRVSNKVATEKATSINVTCLYNTRVTVEAVKVEKQLSLRLYSESEFETIPNPYEKLANGGPVTDRTMFYGRNEFIDRITEAIISTDSKQVVIYGQKRSGKSSVLYHLKKSLEDTKKTFCISFSIGEIFENISSATFFHKILFTIEEELENLAFDGLEVPNFKCPSYSEINNSPNPADVFRKYIRNFKRTCLNTPDWADKKLVIMIDEFTYLYTAIKEGKVSDAIMKQWKAITQNEDATFSSVLVGQDVFPLFKSEFPNEFGITQDERLTYLSKKDTLKLIEEPVWNRKSNKSRYLEDAAEKIIEYTSCNPYYIQIFCARLTKEMNDNKFIEATSSDIKPIAESFLYGGQALTNDKFDNLLNAGEKHDIQRIPQEHSKAVLKKIAEATKFVPFCSREDINIGNKDYEDLILDDLKNREVIEQQGNNYQIQVKLFQEWLLKN